MKKYIIYVVCLLSIVSNLLHAAEEPRETNPFHTAAQVAPRTGTREAEMAMNDALSHYKIRTGISDVTNGKKLHELQAGQGSDAYAQESVRKAVNQQDLQGNTPLHIAAANPTAIRTEEFVRLGADINAKNDAGETALHIAAKNTENPYHIERLLQDGADVNAQRC